MTRADYSSGWRGATFFIMHPDLQTQESRKLRNFYNLMGLGGDIEL